LNYLWLSLNSDIESPIRDPREPPAKTASVSELDPRAFLCRLEKVPKTRYVGIANGSDP